MYLLPSQLRRIELCNSRRTLDYRNTRRIQYWKADEVEDQSGWFDAFNFYTTARSFQCFCYVQLTN